MLLNHKELVDLTAQLNVYASTRNADPSKLLKIGTHIFDVPEFTCDRETMQISAWLVASTGTTKMRPLSEAELGQVCIQVLAHSRLV